MPDFREHFVHKIRSILDGYGIDPFYAVTIFAIAIAISYRKELKDWENIQSWRKGIILMTIAGAVIFTIMSLLRLAGIMRF